MKYVSKKEYSNFNGGYTLLFAVLIASLVLSIGLSVFNISMKEFILSSAGRESQFAFYAADTGIECALYWDFQQAAFSSTTQANTIRCLGLDRVVGGVLLGEESRFTLTFPPPEEYCVEVVVVKEDVSPRRTRIEARGRNSCDPTYGRRVERAIRVRY